MNDEVIIKRDPAVLIFKFIAIEVAAFLLYIAATMFGNAKYELYTQLPLSSLLSYQVAKILFLSGAELAVTIYAFLSWHYQHYIIRPGSITYTHGVFSKRENSIKIDGSTELTISSNLFGRIFHYGSVRATTGTSSLDLTYVSRPERIMGLIKYENAFQKKPDITRLLDENEHEKLEFKSSLRFDHKTGQASRDVEKAAMKTIAAFLNSEGGYLILGVNDARMPLGIENDYRTLQRKDADGFENHFTQTFNSMIGPEFRNLIKLWFHKLDEHELCIVQVLAGPRPAYLKADNNEQFYMRTGNISTALKLSEIEAYSRSRWPKHGQES